MRTDDLNPKLRYFRANSRFYCVDSEWFYTRRAGDQGPFPSEEAAANHLQMYLDELKLQASHEKDRERRREEEKQRSLDELSIDDSIWDRQADAS